MRSFRHIPDPDEQPVQLESALHPHASHDGSGHPESKQFLSPDRTIGSDRTSSRTPRSELELLRLESGTRAFPQSSLSNRASGVQSIQQPHNLHHALVQAGLTDKTGTLRVIDTVVVYQLAKSRMARGRDHEGPHESSQPSEIII